MMRLRYVAFLGLLCCLPPLVGCGATNLSASISAGSNNYASDDTIQSRIDGEFTGWEGNTEFKLENGQTWRQTSYAYTYYYAYRPEVTIYRSDADWKLKVDGLDDTITVEQVY